MLSRGGESLHGMQRVRIGLTGLAFIFMLVLLAAIFTRPSEEAPITPNTIEQQMADGSTVNAADAEPKEPLAELGVAPGNADTNQTNNTARSPSARR
jgi:hypothetical protein